LNVCDTGTGYTGQTKCVDSTITSCAISDLGLTLKSLPHTKW